MSDVLTKADLDALETGVDGVLSKIQSLLQLEAYAEDLPIIGSQLSQAQAALQTIVTLRQTIHDAIDVISNLPDLASQTAAQIRTELQDQINTALGSLAGSGYAGLVNVTVNETTGDIALVFDTGRTTTTTFAAGDLGMSGLGLNMSGNATAALSYDFNFKVGLDSGGFYFDTGASNLSLGVDVSLNSLNAQTSLGFLNFTATNIPDSDPAAGADTLALDLVTSWNQSGLVRDFSGDLLNVTASGDLDLDVHLAADMGNAALPSISSDLHVDWSFSQNLLNGTSANSWNPATVTFDNVEYDFGTFVEQFVTPLLEQLDPILEPINDALAVLRTDISGILLPAWVDILDVVDDGRVTALDFLQLASNAASLGIDFGPLAQVIDLVDTIVDVVEFFRGRDFADAGFEVGNYQVQLQQIQGAVDTLANLDLSAGTFSGAGVNLDTFVSGLGGLAGFNAAHNGHSGADLLGDLLGNTMLTFAPAENPLSIIQLLLGQDIDLFSFDLPTINIGIGMDASGNVTTPITAAVVPIWPLPLVSANLNVALQAVIDLAFGYDTTGLNQYAAGGFSDPGLILNGFYLDDQRLGDTDIPEVVIRAAVEFALDANFAVVSAGGGGNLVGSLALDFADALFGEDARLYINELPGDFLTNPFQIFDVSGRVTAGLRFYVNSVVGNLVNWNSERMTLADFSFVQGAETAGPPPGLADQVGGALWINMGPRAGERDITERVDYGESFEIGAGPGGKVVVQAFGYTQVFGESETVTSLEIDAGNGNDEVLLDPALTIAARITGGAGYDTLTGGAGNDHIFGGTEGDWLRGNGGADELRGEDGNDYIEGGAGADIIDGGAGSYDIATYLNSAAGITLNLGTGVHLGDAAGDTFAGIEVFEGSRHADVMTGSSGTDVFAAIEGDDTLDGAGGDDILVGGTGANHIDGGAGYDIANYYFSQSGITVAMTGTGGTVVAGPAGARTIDDTLVGIEQVNGSDFADTMTGGTGRQVFVGGDGSDTLDGGDDSDILVGGAGGDSLTGGAGVDYASYFDASTGVTASLASGGTGGDAAGDTFTGIENLLGSDYADTLTGDGQNNYLFGGNGDDALAGGGGNDVLEGGAGGDSFDGGAGIDEVTYAGSASGITLDLRTPGLSTGDAANDSLSSIETISGSNFADVIRGSDAIPSGMSQSIQVTADNAGPGGSGPADGDVGVYAAWTASNPVEFLIDTSALGAAVSGALTIEAIDVEPAAAEAGGATEQDEVLLNGVSLGFLNVAANRDNAPSTTTFVVDPALLRADGQNIITVRNVNTVNPGGWYFSITSATLELAVGTVETIKGGGGNDVLYGGLGDDVLIGEAGSDTLEGEDGNDTLQGSDGVDTLRGGNGNDTLHGGRGNDSFDGGAGLDRVTYFDSAGGVRVNLSNSALTLGGVTVSAFTALDGLGGTDGFVSAGGQSTVENATGSLLTDYLAAAEGGSRLEGLDGNDVLSGRGGDDTLVGGSGADYLSGGSGNDVLEGGLGADTLNGNGGALDIASYENDSAGVVASLALGTATDGGGATDTLLLVEGLRGSAHADQLTGDGLANRLEGLGGDDVLDGGTGGDTMVGGRGDDVYYVDKVTAASGNDVVIEVSGEGNDLIRTSVDYGSASVAVALAANVEDLQLLGSVIYGYGNSAANNLIGNAANNVLDGLGGSDRFWGYAGDDTYVFDTWGDQIGTGAAPRGSSSADGEIAGGGTDRIILYTGLLTTEVHDANFSIDTAWGQQIENVTLADAVRSVNLVGNALDNRLEDNILSQTLSGQGGNDTLVFSGGADTAHGGSGTDLLVIKYGAATSDLYVNYGFYGDGAGGVYGRYTNAESSVYFDSIERFDITSGSGSDSLFGWQLDDILRSGGGNDYVDTAQGNDIADGGEGSDRISADLRGSGGAVAWSLPANTYVNGNGVGSFTNFEYFGTIHTADGDFDDAIVTGTGNHNETVNTYDGDDIVTISAGSDTVAFGSGDDTLVIDYATATTDTWVNYGFYASAAGGVYGRYTNAADSVYFDSVEHFRITTGSGSDSLFGWERDDILRSGSGDDYVDTAQGNDIADGGEGSDRISADLRGSGGAVTWDLPANIYTNANGVGSFTNFEYFGTIHTADGDFGDTIVTGTGNHNETVSTYGGNDTVSVTAGGDTIALGTGDDTLVIDYAASTSDVWVNYGFYSAAAGGVYGRYTDAANSVYFDSVEHFVITSGSGNDSLFGWERNDILRSGLGDDLVDVGAGNDTADGGEGTDRISANLEGAASGSTWNLQTNSYVNAGAYGNFTNFEYFGTVRGTAFSDSFVSTSLNKNESVYGGGGNDSFLSVNGADNFFGEGGSDRLIVDWRGATGTSSVTYGLYDHGNGNGFYGTYTNSDGRSAHFETLEHVTFWGSEQSDAITAWGGDDVFQMGGGDDFANVGAGTNTVDGGAGIDRLGIDFTASAQAISLDLTRTGAQLLSGPGAISGIEWLSDFTATTLADTIVTTSFARDDRIWTGDGNDAVTVFNGSDEVRFGAGSDRLVVDWSAAAGTSSVTYGLYDHGNGNGFYGRYTNTDGRSVYFENLEHVTFRGSAQADSITAWGGDDDFRMGDGDDFANVGGGINIVDGGAGIDRLGIDYSGSGVAINLDLTRTGEQLSSGPGSIRGIEWLNGLTGSNFNDNIVTTAVAANDAIAAGSGDDTVTVYNGADDISLGSGSDRLIVDWSGATGTSSVTYGLYDHGGGNGFYGTYSNSDGRSVHFELAEHITFRGSAQADAITAWGGDDLFLMGGGDDFANVGGGTNTVDGGSGVDRLGIDYSASLTAISLNLGLAGEQLLSGPGSIRGIEWLNGLTGSALGDTIVTGGLALNDWISTGGGNDRVTVLAGADEVFLGEGDDTIVVDWRSSTGTVSVTYGFYGSGGPTFYGTISSSDGYSVHFEGAEHLEVLLGSGNGSVYGWSSADILTGGSGNDTLSGNGGADVINGGGGNDVLDGGTGADTMRGNLGDDVFYVEDAGDLVTEFLGQGTDTVRTTLVSYALTGNVENLVGLLSTGQTLTGNGEANAITGGSGNDTLNGYSGDDVLDGGSGADTMRGNLGDDIFYVDSTGDQVIEFANQGTDTVRTTLATYSLTGSIENLTGIGNGQTLIGNQFDNAITGSVGNDTLRGYSGHDTLDGGTGTDAMFGNQGNDIYVVDNAGDSVTEYFGEGTDTVRTSLASYSLGAHLENLVGLLSSGQTLNGNNLENAITGGVGADTLNGYAGNDTLDGGGGADTMRGNLGNDIYYVDNAADQAIESLNEGTDTVRTSLASYTLGAHLENLTGLLSTGQALTGNNLDNTIVGGAGNDRLNGSLGADTLTGGAGADTFVFAYYPGTTFPYGSLNSDLILDFASGVDRIELAASAFAQLSPGALSAAAFYAGTAAHDADDRIIYDAATGKLWYDPDGTGGQAAMLFATLGTGSHPATLAATDFVVV